MSVRDRMRVVSKDAPLAMGAAIGVLLIVVPTIVLVSLVATGRTGDSGGFLVLAMLLATGAYVCFSTLRQAGVEKVVRHTVVTDSTGLYGVTVEAPQPVGTAPPVWWAVAAVLALLVFGSLAIAIVMSVLDDHLGGRRRLATIVVSVLVLVVMLVVGWVLRAVTARRASHASRRRSGR